MVKTESIGEARGLMEVMDNCDGIVVAGGDGALSEAVTGLLRRSDNSSAAQHFPVGIIPVGKNNNVAKAIFKEFKSVYLFLLQPKLTLLINLYFHFIQQMTELN